MEFVRLINLYDENKRLAEIINKIGREKEELIEKEQKETEKEKNIK